MTLLEVSLTEKPIEIRKFTVELRKMNVFYS